MILINGRKLIIPKTDSTVGFQGDNLVETRSFELTKTYYNIDLSLLEFKLDIASGNGYKNIVDLHKEILGEKIILTWLIIESHLFHEGLAQIQVRGFAGSLVKWHSDIEYILIKKSINASDAFPDPLPSEFEEMEARVTAAKNITIEASEIAVEAKNIAIIASEESVEAKNLAIESKNAAALSKEKSKTSEDNAKASEDNAKESEEIAKESENNAKESETNAKTSENNARLAETNAISKSEVATSAANAASDALDEFITKANKLINVGPTQPVYGLWIKEV